MVGLHTSQVSTKDLRELHEGLETLWGLGDGFRQPRHLVEYGGGLPEFLGRPELTMVEDEPLEQGIPNT